MNLKNVLVVDDHPIFADAIKQDMLQNTNKVNAVNFKINTAFTCDEAIDIINKSQITEPLDLVILDINLKPSREHNILSGEDLGIKLREYFNNIKIIVLTALNNNHALFNIFKTIKPEGFLIKSDISLENLSSGIKNVLSGQTVYSNSINNLITGQLSNKHVLDDIDRKILHYLSLGYKTKDLPKIINLSLGGIERRKKLLREIFDTPSRDDKALVETAKQKGFI
ncbi:response regulator [Aestuariibaculum sp. M13]|uniref:response regulator n=1 Tax=Aestuariibaculum sp. M13 TaxID=2967132 RepID=UPI002159F21A|nr:response regulator [Aestuariibaculum sp. M13]MCR8667504.1 response regulator [Aestuariibaculum sp. M13]